MVDSWEVSYVGDGREDERKDVMWEEWGMADENGTDYMEGTGRH